MATEIPRRGPIRNITLPRVVRDLWRARASGVLRLENREATKKIIFKNGDIVFAATSEKHERLGERLVRAGKIKRSVLDLACRVMERSHLRLGRTIVEWGWLSPAEIEHWVAEQIKDIIYSVFTWEAGEFRFEPAEEPVDPDLALELQTAEVIYEGVRRIANLDAIREGVGDLSRPVRLAGGKRLGIPVTQEDGYILSRVDGRATIADLLAASPLGEEEALRRVYGLLLAGVLERKAKQVQVPHPRKRPAEPGGETSEAEKCFRDALVARYAAMKFGNLYDRLGVDVRAPAEAIEKAYREALGSLEPDSSYRDRIKDLDSQLEKVRRRIVNAYEVLGDPERRREYDMSLGGESPAANTLAANTVAPNTVAPNSSATLTPGTEKKENKPNDEEEAELRYAEAQRFWQGGEYFDAIAAANDAVRLNPRKHYYHLLLARLLAENPSCWETARDHFKRTIELAPDEETAYRELAALYEREGDEAGARRVYRRLQSIQKPSSNHVPTRSG